MPRNISTAAKLAMFSREYSGVCLLLLTIDHPNLALPIRLVQNTEDVTSRGNVFTAFPFQITFPSDEEGRLGNSTITIDNIERTLLSALGSIDTPPEVILEAVLSETPDVVDASHSFTWRATRFNPQVIEADLQYEDFLNERFPKDDYTPSTFPGLF